MSIKWEIYFFQNFVTFSEYLNFKFALCQWLSLRFRTTGCLIGACLDISTAKSGDVSPEDAVLIPASSLMASENCSWWTMEAVLTSSSSLESNPESGRSPDSESPGPSLLDPEVWRSLSEVIVVLDPGLLLSELGGGGGGGPLCPDKRQLMFTNHVQFSSDIIIFYIILY